ncbi:MAG TPA: hypothetical protein VFM86_05600 [Pedococcus sp.]|nr:hypothetical protein [Pedococcus sp.]
MTTTAAPGTPARPAGRPAPAAASSASAGSVRTPGATPAGSTPSGFRAAVVLALLLTGPAVYLVAKRELSPHDALVRFGCAWAFATAGVALVLSTVGGGSSAAGGDPAELAPEEVADPAPAGSAAAEPAGADPAYAGVAPADPGRVDGAAATRAD